MFFTKHRQLIRWIIIIASFGIISLILWNTYVFFQKFKAEERIKMQNWSFAQQDIIQNMDLNGDIGNLPLKILESNTTTPMIKLNEDGSMDYNNIDEKKARK